MWVELSFRGGYNGRDVFIEQQMVAIESFYSYDKLENFFFLEKDVDCFSLIGFLMETLKS